jgi:hypothetical protein
MASSQASAFAVTSHAAQPRQTAARAKTATGAGKKYIQAQDQVHDLNRENAPPQSPGRFRILSRKAAQMPGQECREKQIDCEQKTEPDLIHGLPDAANTSAFLNPHRIAI